VSAITLRFGKKIEVPTPQPTPKTEVDPATLQRKRDAHVTSLSTSSVPSTPSTSTVAPPNPLHFPPKSIPSKKMEEILETFRKVEVNIPLLDAIKQISKYAKFLKVLCTHKRILNVNEKINMGRNALVLIGKSIPHILEKCKDPCTFYVPYIIGNNKFENAMLDLGASINVMPLSIFKSLSLGPFHPTSVVILLVNRSVAHHVGLVDELIFPADFYILDMEERFSHGYAPIILGKPFSKTARTKIDVHAGTLSIEFDDIIVRFNILDAMKHPSEDHSIFHIDIIDDVVDEHISNFHPLHCMKYASMSELFEFECIGVDSDSYCDCDSYFDFDVDSEFDSLGVVPIDFDVTRSKCINHVARSIYASDCYVEV